MQRLIAWLSTPRQYTNFDAAAMTFVLLALILERTVG